MAAKAKALDRQAAIEAERERKQNEENEKKSSIEWSVGTKDSSRSKAMEEKEAEKQRNLAEKAAALAADEASTSGIKKIAKTKKKGKDDFDLLNQALKAAPKTKAQKEAEAAKLQAEERKKADELAREKKAARLKVFFKYNILCME